MLKKTQKRSLVYDIVKQIEEAIVSKQYNVGDKLPSINDMQEIIGASQGTIREAFSVLSQKGLIEVKVGVKGGAYVKEQSSEAVVDWLGILIRQNKLTYKEIADFRKDVEVGLINLVANNITKDDFNKLDKFLIKLNNYSNLGSKGWPQFIETENQFRKTLLKIANNRMYEAILVSIYEFLYTYALQLDTDEEIRPDLAYDDFRKIINAMRNGDIAKASCIAVQHINRYIKAISHKIDA